MIVSLLSIGDIEGKGLKIKFISSDLNELVKRVSLLHQEEIAGNDSEFPKDDIIALVKKLQKYGSLTKEYL